jgi:hypothetical protein
VKKREVDGHREYRCGYCYKWRAGGDFWTPPGMGLMCSACIVDRLGYHSIEQYQREQFDRNRNPRGA